MIHKTISLYEDRPHITLTTYVLDNSPEMLNGRKRPAVLVCPGGAYLGCSDREAEPVAMRFAAMGYHAFVLRYATYFIQFSGPGDLSENMPVNPDSLYPASMRDIGKAFLTIRAHADEWLVDTDKIAICGFSAGGHNCAMYATSWHRPVLHEHLGVQAEELKPAAAIIGYPISDYHIMFGEVTDPIAQKISHAASIALLGTTTPTKAQLDEVSPTQLVTKQTPPMFVWATGADDLVPVENSTVLATTLARQGVPFELHVFEEGAHGLSLADQATAGSSMNIDHDAAKWMSLAEAWLIKRFALEIPTRPAWMPEG